MVVFQTAVFVLFVIWLSYKEKETLTDMIPVGVCLLVLVLYGLSLVNGLLWWDYLALFFCFLLAVRFVRAGREGRKRGRAFVLEELKKPGNMIALILLVSVPVLVSGKAVSWWDDYNFWATDAASVFYLNGFADKYCNVAAEFGDYPPGTQMIKWWFLHFSPGQFREGLLFSGYYFMNLAFLVPLLTYVRRWNIPLMVLSGAALWLFPSTVEVFGYDGCCADLTMAVVYGSFLVSVMDDKGHSRGFYYGRQALLLMVLVLCKNTGFLWAGFGLLFDYGCHILRRKESSFRGLAAVTFLTAAAGASWLLFCMLNQRVAKLTGAAIRMAVGSARVPEVKKETVSAFFTAFWKFPLHREKTFALDVSPLSLYLLLLIFVFLLYRRGKLEKRSAWFVGVFLGMSGLCFYGINLISHLTIFAGETQYLEPYGMVSSIERYGAPFTIGGLYLTAYLLLSSQTDLTAAGGRRKEGKAPGRAGEWRGLLCCLLFVFLTADYESAYRGIWGYRNTVSEILSQRQEIVDGQAREFLEKAGARQPGNSYRVLYVRDISDISWVRNTYVNYEAVPVSVMHGNVDAETMEVQDVQRMMEESHAGYFYADEIAGGRKLLEVFTGGEPFCFGSLYRITEQDGKLRLQKV